MTPFLVDPLAAPPMPAFMGAHDRSLRSMTSCPQCAGTARDDDAPITVSWLSMALEGLRIIAYAPAHRHDAFPGDPHLQMAINHGRTLKAKLDTMPSEMGDRFIDTPVLARQLRLYLGSVSARDDGTCWLEGCRTIVEAEIRMGIRDALGDVMGVWR